MFFLQKTKQSNAEGVGLSGGRGGGGYGRDIPLRSIPQPVPRKDRRSLALC